MSDTARSASPTAPRPTGAPAPAISHLAADAVTRAHQLIALYPEPRSALIPLCHLAQEQDGWLRPEAVEEIAELCGVTAAEVRGTATFYDMLHTEPVGTYVVSLCTNIACMLGGADGRTLFMLAAEWRGMDHMTSEARTGQVLTARAPAPHIGWP